MKIKRFPPGKFLLCGRLPLFVCIVSWFFVCFPPSLPPASWCCMTRCWFEMVRGAQWLKLWAPYFETQPRIPSLVVWWYHLDLESQVGLAFLKKLIQPGLLTTSGILRCFWHSTFESFVERVTLGFSHGLPFPYGHVTCPKLLLVDPLLHYRS